MIKVFSFVFFLVWVGTACAQPDEVTTLILVRHAEKMDDGTRDPELSTAGKERANDLINLLRETPIDAIYTTDYKRTRETVTPLAREKGMELKAYTPKDKAALTKIIGDNKGKTIVMVGHSNTTPWVANALLGEDKYPDWKDDDYDNVLILSLRTNGTANVTWLTYGKAAGQ